MNPETIRQALETLGLPQWITRQEIKERYRKLAREVHPDRTGDAEAMERINAAYAVLMEYIDTFRYRFDDAEIAQHYPESGHAEQFRF
jgi:DnaJ-class molecular chaperone